MIADGALAFSNNRAMDTSLQEIPPAGVAASAASQEPKTMSDSLGPFGPTSDESVTRL